jgi:hypothetical protein
MNEAGENKKKYVNMNKRREGGGGGILRWMRGGGRICEIKRLYPVLR